MAHMLQKIAWANNCDDCQIVPMDRNGNRFNDVRLCEALGYRTVEESLAKATQSDHIRHLMMSIMAKYLWGK